MYQGHVLGPRDILGTGNTALWSLDFGGLFMTPRGTDVRTRGIYTQEKRLAGCGICQRAGREHP